MSRRIHTLTIAVALAGGALVTAQSAGADGGSGRSVNDVGAWISRSFVAFGADEHGHASGYVGTDYEYGPNRWEGLYLDETGALQDVLVSPGPSGAVTATAVDLGEGNGWDGPGAFDVDPVTGNAVICGRGGSNEVVFVVRSGSAGTWSAPRTASVPADQFAGPTACAVNGTAAVIASGTTTAEANDYYGARTVRTVAATTSLSATGVLALTAVGDSKFANSSWPFPGGDVQSAANVSAAAAGSTLVVGATVAGVSDTSGSPAYSATTTLVTFAGNTTSTEVHSNHFAEYPTSAPNATAPVLADLGGAVLATDAYGAYRITDEGATKVLSSTHSDGSPRYQGIQALPQSAQGPAWVLTRADDTSDPALRRVTASGTQDIVLPTDTTFDDAVFDWAYQYAWASATAPDGSLWLNAPCNSNGNYAAACLVRYSASGARVGRIEATSHDPLPFTSGTGEGLRFNSSYNPQSYHFDSEAPVDSGAIYFNFPRYDGAIAYQAGDTTYLHVDTTDPSTPGGAGALQHRWTVNGAVLPDQDFGTMSTSSPQYVFPAVGEYTVTHQARDAAGNVGNTTSTLIKVVDPQAPLSNLGPVTSLAVTQAPDPDTGGVVVHASWTGVANADRYYVEVVDGSSNSVGSDSTTATSADVSLGSDVIGTTLTLKVSPARDADGVGLPASQSFLVAGTPDTTAPTGTYAVTPAAAWSSVTTVTVTQSALSDNVDATSDVTRVINWGDGSGDDTWENPATSKKIAHIYTKAGSFRPKVTLNDQAGNERTYTLTVVAVKKDATRPTITLTRPAKAALTKVSAWTVLRGTAKDGQSGLDGVYVFVVEKRGKLFYAYNYSTKKWTKGYPKLGTATEHVFPTYPRTSAAGVWAAPAIKGLTKGTLYATYAAFDKAGNATVPVTVTQALTR